METQKKNKKIWYVVLTAVIIFAMYTVGLSLLLSKAKIEYEIIDLEPTQSFSASGVDVSLVSAEQNQESTYISRQITLNVTNTDKDEISLGEVLYFNDIYVRYVNSNDKAYKYDIKSVYTDGAKIESLYDESLQPLVTKTYTFYFTTPIIIGTFELVIKDKINFKIGKYTIE